ncbi:hypothetical protein BX666DRAFT_1982690 [Dichotomocladium elegans]|nr:hypothetical protein BX666DRAFT_1982690 [Dichotomocladium elegans]
MVCGAECLFLVGLRPSVFSLMLLSCSRALPICALGLCPIDICCFERAIANYGCSLIDACTRFCLHRNESHQSNSSPAGMR